MRGKNLLCAICGFLMVLVSAYFGASVYGAQSNELIRHLDVMDKIYNYSADAVPQLNYQAALFSLPLLLIILVTEIIIILKSKIRQVKNIAIGLAVAAVVVLIVAFLTLSNPYDYNFSLWGYVWLTMGIFITAGNILSVFIKGNT